MTNQSDVVAVIVRVRAVRAIRSGPMHVGNQCVPGVDRGFDAIGQRLRGTTTLRNTDRNRTELRWRKWRFRPVRALLMLEDQSPCGQVDLRLFP